MNAKLNQKRVEDGQGRDRSNSIDDLLAHQRSAAEAQISVPKDRRGLHPNMGGIPVELSRGNGSDEAFGIVLTKLCEKTDVEDGDRQKDESELGDVPTREALETGNRKTRSNGVGYVHRGTSCCEFPARP
jgi:hypothetical protein